MADLTGQRLGPYRLDALIGRGGMATVYRARQESFGRDVAIKVMDPGLSHGEEFLARFEREAQVIARLEHPHILPVIDFGRDDGHVYLVMRLIESGTLSARLHDRMMSLAQIDQLLQHIAAALDYAHQRGVVHRDLKPDNVLLDDAGNAYLTDFGIAKMLASTGGNLNLTGTGNILGTPAYMAPEQWRSEAIDARTDIYALGVILYQMLLGMLPFSADTPFGMMFQHVDSAPPPPCALSPALPGACERVVLRALAKQPDARYPVVRQMADDFHRAVETLPRASQHTLLPRVQPEALGGLTVPSPLPPVPPPAQPQAQSPVRAATITPPPVIAAPPPARVMPPSPPRRASRRRLWIASGAVGLLAILAALAVGLLLMDRDGSPAGPTPTRVASLGDEAATPVESTATPTTPPPTLRVTNTEAVPVALPATTTPPPPVTPDAQCGGYPTQMTVGAGGRTTLYPDAPTRVRQSPGTDAPVVRSIPPGMMFRVESGPVCQNDIYWYEIMGVSTTGLWSGWIGEGQGGTAWIEPFDTGSIECPGAPPPRLVPGQQGRVTFDPPLPSRLRAAPTTESGEGNVLERLQPGKVFDVISGPACDAGNTWRWWLVKAASGAEGWMAEGVTDEYWLEPMT